MLLASMTARRPMLCRSRAPRARYHLVTKPLTGGTPIMEREARAKTAMVAGIELEPEYEMSWQQAADTAIQGAEDLCSRGIIPIYSLYWPVGGRDHKDYMSRLRSFFENLNIAYADIRRNYDLTIWEGFMCHKCAYMQLECDVDRGMAAMEAT